MNLDATIAIVNFINNEIDPLLLIIYECLENVIVFIDKHKEKNDLLIQKIWNTYFVNLMEKCASSKYPITEKHATDLLFDLIAQDKLLNYKSMNFEEKLSLLDNYLNNQKVNNQIITPNINEKDNIYNNEYSNVYSNLNNIHDFIVNDDDDIDDWDMEDDI